MSLRKDIRASIVASLIAGATSAGARVYNSRALPVEPDEILPAISLYTESESVDTDFQKMAHSRMEKRQLVVTIEALDYVTDDIDAGVNYADLLDPLVDEIEAVMSEKQALDAYPEGVQLVTYTGMNMAVDTSGNKLVAGAQMNFTIDYILETTTDASTLDDFERARSEMTLVGGVPDTKKFKALAEIP